MEAFLVRLASRLPFGSLLGLTRSAQIEASRAATGLAYLPTRLPFGIRVLLKGESRSALGLPFGVKARLGLSRSAQIEASRAATRLAHLPARLPFSMRTISQELNDRRAGCGWPI